MPIWKIHHLDVKTVFLNCDLNEDVYVTQPEGFVTQQSTVRFMTGSWSLECKTRLCSQGDGVHEVHERIGNMSKEREGGACNHGQIFR